MSANKRKRNVLNIETKLKTLERLDNGESVKRICFELGVGRSTVKDWRKNRKSLEDFSVQIESEKVLSSRCTMKKPKNEIVDIALWVWFMQEREKGTPISGPILMEKAIQLHKLVSDEGEFVASDGWLSRWKKRHGVHYLNVSNEKLSPERNVASELSEKLLNVVQKENLTLEQIYNFNEANINFKFLPDKKTITSQEQTAAGFEMNKERFTLAICTNVAGSHKLPLFVVGKTAKPRTFKNINLNALPVYYKAQKSAWMNSFLFEEWFSTAFVPKVKEHLKRLKLPIKALLVLHDVPTHPINLATGDIKVMVLPPDLVQSMNQDVILSFKRRYRRKLLNEILHEVSNNKDIDFMAVLNKINLKDVIYMMASAFEEMPSSIFTNSWKKIWPGIEKSIDQCNIKKKSYDEHLEDDDNSSLLNDFKRLAQFKSLDIKDINEWLINDNTLQNELLTDDEIIETIKQEELVDNKVLQNAKISREDINDKISHLEGKNAFDTAMKYIEEQADSSATDILFIRKWRDFALTQNVKSKEQIKITELSVNK